MDNFTFAALIDSLRHDEIDASTTPFLFSLKQNGCSGTVTETFAFQTRPAFFAGLEPEDCGIGNLFYYNPHGSPFKLARFLPKSHKSRVITEKLAAIIEARRGHDSSSFYTGTYDIPLKLLPYFDLSEKFLTTTPGSLGSSETIFDILRKEKRQWLWIAYPTHPQGTLEILEEFQKKFETNDYSFVFLHFGELDWAGHKFGPHSTERKRVLSEIDEVLKKIFSIVNKSHEKPQSLIFGDHGMVQVDRYLDIKKVLKALPYNAPRDYVYFLDSTQARFWFKNNEAKNGIGSALKELKGGRILNNEDLGNLHFRFHDNRYGELIYMVEEGNTISPNFFGRNPVKGMHGYLPEVDDNWTTYIANTSEEKSKILSKKYSGRISLTDIYPILKLLVE